MKTFVVATNADYTVLIRAKTKESAEKKANLFAIEDGTINLSDYSI